MTTVDALLPIAPPTPVPVLSRVRYRAKQGALALTTGPLLDLWHRFFDAEHDRVSDEAIAALQRHFRTLLDRDLANVAAGWYPEALLFDPPLASNLSAWPEALADIPRLFSRKRHARHDDLPAETPVGDYPAYYRRNFHWQTDGWLSERSARIYDLQTGFLFFGTLPLMRRMGLPPIVRALRGKRGARVLDVGCGTGRYLRQLHLALPEAKLYGVDLSPFYLRQAERTLAQVPGVALLAENGEAMPIQSDSMAAAVSNYLCHELPHDVRRRVLREIHRTLQPGGAFVLVDSLQRDGAVAKDLSPYLEWFPSAYHEPYYKDWIADEASALLRECGFEVTAKEDFLLSRVVVGRKPG
jgi:ubiquinone/menaquinone biosynthesis C-methylase UbiE